MFFAQLQVPSGQLPGLPLGPALERARGPIEIPPYEPWQIGLMIGLLALVLGLLIYCIVFIIRRRRARTPQLSASTTALAELQAAAELTTTDDERFAVLSSLALRRYFEVGKHIPSLGRTTFEFLHALDANSQLNSDARASLREFLEHCDQVKFARASLSTDARNALTESAIQLVHELERHHAATSTEATTT